MLMLCFEWWALEVLALFAGRLGVNELAAQVLAIQIVGFIFMLPLGIAYAASALTGNYLGEGKVELAKSFARMVVIFDIGCTTVIVFLIAVFNKQVSEIFTQEKDVVSMFRSTVWAICLFIFWDTIHGV